jgi:hypothetical protein
MDELTLLRELDADTPPPAPRAMYDARMRLRYEVAYERDRRRPSQAPRVLATAAIGVGAIVLGGGEEATTPEPRVQLTAAGEWLEAAARDAAAEADVPGTVPRDDQYLYVREVTEERPLDGSGPRRRYVDEGWTAVGPDRPSRFNMRGRLYDTQVANWPPRRYEDLRRMPTDPGRLLLVTRDGPELETVDTPLTASDYFMAYGFLLTMLHDDAPMPPDLRAAIFDALARIPGVEMTDEVVDARGRRGVGFTGPDRPGYKGSDPLWQTVIIDPETYEYLGSRGTAVREEDGERVEQVSAVVERAVVDRIGQRP